MRVTTSTTGQAGRHLVSMRTNHAVVDAGPNRGGLAEAPTPGEYFLAGFGACAVVVMSGVARAEGIAYSDIRAEAEIHRNADDPHQIDGISLTVTTRGMSEAEAQRLEALYRQECPLYAIVARGASVTVALNVLP